MEPTKNHYLVRLLARSMDIMMIGLLVRVSETIFTSLQINLLIWFLLYNLTVAVFKGKTLGKFSFSLSVECPKRGGALIISLVLREILFVVLLPFLFINVICTAPLPLHDRISGTRVIRNET